MWDISWILTLLIALVTWFLTRHWLKIKLLPPGPFPLPIVGNLLSFRSKPFDESIKVYRNRYGGIFTVWFGSIPHVIVSDQKMIREGVLEKKTDFAGRPAIPLFDAFLKDSISITGSSYSKPWEILRKMGQSAIRKYATSERLPPLVDELTDGLVEKMLKQDAPFDPKVDIQHLVFNIIGSTIAGEIFKEDDPDIRRFHQSVDDFQKYMSTGLIAHFIPLLKVVRFYRNGEKEMFEFMEFMLNFINTRVDQHVKTYQSTDIRDMIDSLLSARDEAVAEFGAENTPHLSDKHLFRIIVDIFGAATDTTSSTIRWLLLFVTMHPEIQEKMIQELRDNIGDRIPTQQDRRRCPYTSAVIHETTRMKAIAPYGLPHTAIRDSTIGGYPIPNGTVLVFHYAAIHSDDNAWKEPEKFMPERFLSPDGNLNDASRTGQLMPFGIGRRNCIGEKLATEEIFMVISGIFRRCRLTLDTPPEDTNTETMFFETPKHHTLRAVRLDK